MSCDNTQCIEMLGILSDAHGNYHAFQYGIDVLKQLGAKKIMFLGDAVGYIPSVKVVEYLMNMEELMFCIRGNHEEMLLHDDIDPKRDLVYQLNETKSLMTKSDIDFIASWSVSYTMDAPIGRLHFVHGSPSEPTNGYVYPDSDLSVFETNADFVFMGHSHYPFIRKCEKTTYINVGSCGLPRDDGRYGAVALFNPETGAIRIVRFDIRNSTVRSLADSSVVHTSVKDLFFRQKQKIFGDLYEL